jgi:phosphoglucosamine mutase
MNTMGAAVRTRLFGTDGIRGTAGEHPLDTPTLRAIGQALGELLGGEILMGRDTRESGPRILQALTDGIEAVGARVRSAGVIPTPGVALLAQRTGASGGVMISASHNPFSDNGIKAFGPDGRKLDDADEARIEERVAEILVAPPPAARESEAPLPDPDDEAASEDQGRYLGFLSEGFPSGPWLEGFRITLDCANGATGLLAPRLFRSLGATVDTTHAAPNGENINAACGAVHPESLLARVRARGGDLGVAYDGDGDRAIFVTASGRLIDGDGILLLMARSLAADGKLEPPVVVGTSMTNVALERQLAAEGVRLERVDVGDRYVFARMLEGGFLLGGEPSGHVIFPDHRISGDGLLTTLKVAELLRTRGWTLDSLLSDWRPAPQLIRNVTVTSKPPIEAQPEIASKIEEIRSLLGPAGRIVVRYSGTEPLLRIMIESDSDARNRTLAGDLEAVCKRVLPLNR